MLLYVINVIQSHYSVTEPERTNERYELTRELPWPGSLQTLIY